VFSAETPEEVRRVAGELRIDLDTVRGCVAVALSPRICSLRIDKSEEVVKRLTEALAVSTTLSREGPPG
jgi:hypothetical protein